MTGRDLLERGRALAAHPAVANSLVLQAGQVVTIAIQALTSLILLRTLGPDLVGLYAISTALAAAIALLDVSGANRVALLDVARARGAAAPEHVGPSLARFLCVGALVRVPIVAGFFVLALPIAGALYGRQDAGTWARWLCLPLAIDLPFDLLVIVLQSRGEMRELVQTETSRAIATSACTIVVLLAGLGILGISLVQVGMSVGATAWAVRRYGGLAAHDRTLPGWSELARLARRVDTRSRLSDGFSMAIEKNLGNFGGQLPMLMIGALRTDAAGYFSAALRTMSLPYPLVSAFARYLDVLLPYRAGQGVGAMRHTFLRATMAAGTSWAVVTIGMILLGPVLLVRVVGAGYAPAIPVLYPLVLQSLATGAGVGIGAALRALGKPAHGAALQALSIAVTAPIGYVLVSRTGATGAAWFHALRYGFLTIAGIGWVFWLARSTSPSPRAEPSVK